ncbi:MAG: alpha/beta hydrolase [Candidatus Omnitrophica bacterium]|nr:alpha/beta hydrolase [Candidatus Omnitrophota bacterium]
MIRWLINTMIASMIFFPVREFSARPEHFGLSAEDVWCRTSDGVRIHGWLIPSGATARTTGGGASEISSCLLFFHGNADNISIRLPKAKEWVERGISVLLLDYRGYGKSEGKIDQGVNLYQDAEAAVRWLKENKNFDPSQLILYGESIGAYPAIELAVRQKFRAVILEAPFTSIKELAKKHYGLAPDFFLKDFLMDNESKISELKSPLFILHGGDDEIVPVEMGRRLFEKAPAPKEFFAIQGAHHNDISLIGGTDFYEKPFRFAVGQDSR